MGINKLDPGLRRGDKLIQAFLKYLYVYPIIAGNDSCVACIPHRLKPVASGYGYKLDGSAILLINPLPLKTPCCNSGKWSRHPDYCPRYWR